MQFGLLKNILIWYKKLALSNQVRIRPFAYRIESEFEIFVIYLSNRIKIIKILIRVSNRIYSSALLAVTRHSSCDAVRIWTLVCPPFWLEFWEQSFLNFLKFCPVKPPCNVLFGLS